MLVVVVGVVELVVVGVAVDVVGVLVAGVLVVGVLVVGVLGVFAVLAPSAGSVFCGMVVVRTCSASSVTATNAAATPPRPRTNRMVTMMIGTFQLPGERIRVVAP